ncbi:hypothetical protein [Streptomyces sp. A1547]|uniref:terpene synthase family protein n=1 Tax=Streptomyces sp. A1547 TaxID=2563105 RepID=UPI00109E5E5A|nr:hypothetical protein [Streptomyces sp. A1547]THA29039.1 hypothetical protein E6W17_40140 [Streptomyces sp. A1547]
MAAVIADTFRVLHADPGGPVPEPLRGASLGLWDLMTRAADHMSKEWLGQHRTDVGVLLRGIVHKFLIGAFPEPPDVEAALAVPVDDGMTMFTNDIEYFEGFELPLLAKATSGYVRMRIQLDEATAIQNDVFFIHRDRLTGDSDGTVNIVAALERQHGKGTEHALLPARTMYLDRLTALESACGQFVDQCRSLCRDSESVAQAELYAKNVYDLLHGTCHAHVYVAARGYLDAQPTVPPVSSCSRTTKTAPRRVRGCSGVFAGEWGCPGG